MKKEKKKLPGYIAEKINPGLFQEMFSNKERYEEKITADTIKDYKKIDENLKVGDKVNKIIKFFGRDELQTLYKHKLKEYLKKNKNTTEIDFIEDELIKIDNLLDAVNDGTLSKKESYGLLRRYKEIFVQKLSDIAKKGIAHNKTKLILLGNKNQLYSVFRQLKIKYELIGNSFNSLADFCIESVTGFEHTAKETIEKQLKKKKLPPPNKRINIDLENES